MPTNPHTHTFTPPTIHRRPPSFLQRDIRDSASLHCPLVADLITYSQKLIHIQQWMRPTHAPTQSSESGVSLATETLQLFLTPPNLPSYLPLPPLAPHFSPSPSSLILHLPPACPHHSRSWVNLYCVLNKGELGFYKDAKNTTTPYNNEPLLNLSHCHCDVTNGYKKKKNVFTLKTKDGSEFLFHAKDEEDLKVWVNNITTSISEHEEIAKWGQPQPTTSSTDEGTRRDGSKVDNRSERGGERSDRGDRIERVDKEKEREKEKEKEKERERGERSEKSERGGKLDGKRSEKSSKKK
ncbi:hypothetical protein CRENBAI_004499 [Crenichthys baileyi]|uniref:PH domain-containing protein n=1 Tax=Crenichthys baileyi TaxID=28760 RepID=A0AAV9RNA3_9TELE